MPQYLRFPLRQCSRSLLIPYLVQEIARHLHRALHLPCSCRLDHVSQFTRPRNMRRPSRTTLWSSTIRIRIVIRPPPLYPSLRAGVLSRTNHAGDHKPVLEEAAPFTSLGGNRLNCCFNVFRYSICACLMAGSLPNWPFSTSSATISTRA